MGERTRARTRRLTEAVERTFDEIRHLVQQALSARAGGDGSEVWVRDLTDEWAVWETFGGTPGMWRCTFSIDDDGDVTLGEPEKVDVTTTYEKVSEAVDHIEGRLLEAKADDAAGGRVFRVQVVEAGVSKNGKRYTEAVLRKAAPLYEGAKAYDHHRTVEEMRTSTIDGLVGQYRNVEANTIGIQADLHLLPSAVHTAEALDASLAAVTAGLPPLVGISHDVAANCLPATLEGGRRIQEAAEILSVFSVDVVADPSAGGRVTRMVAGGVVDDPTHPTSPEEGPAMTIEELLALIDGATPEQRAKALEGLGVTAADVEKLKTGTPPPPEELTPEQKAELEKVGAAESFAKDSILGKHVLRTALEQASLDGRLSESVSGLLPERFTEADVTTAIAGYQRIAEGLERANLRPGVPHVQVGTETREKQVDALDKMLSGEPGGYRSLKEAYVDITGDHRSMFDGSDFNRRILRESAAAFDSGQRVTESIDSTTWGQMLGDSISRRVIAEYQLPQLQAWRKIVSSIVPVNDFRTQRRTRVGGYGLLPTVLEGAPYQPLTTAPDEEATYTLAKKGGTEDLTIETIANDDVGAVQAIPRNLGRAAAQTLFRFVFDFLTTNPTLSYDATALFAAGHSNTDASSALAQATLSTGRRKMRTQTAYGNSTEVLGAVAKYLVVPADLEETAFQLATSAVVINANANATIPNIHQGLEPIVIDYFTDTNDWFLVGDGISVPTLELGFYQGRQDPEMFVQNAATVGAPFDADKVVYKIRHIYSGEWLDHRSAYRGQG